jgi:formate hydrogenlyase subunit 6/NADH:ubiquinone oxidoreductase subunit I
MKQSSTPTTGRSRRHFLSIAALFAFTATWSARQKKVKSGLAVIEDNKLPERATPLSPAGSLSIYHLAQTCTACQLCVSACPSKILRPSNKLTSWMQPELSFEQGYCRPECVKCAEVCPTGAIHTITPAEKSAIQIGHAVWISKNCIAITDKAACDDCARHCPADAIQLIALDDKNTDSPKIPAVDTERCTGCGACEHVCPARPFSAIYVEGHEHHRLI